MIIRIENTFGNDVRSLRVHFNQMTDKFGPVKKIGQRRFETLRTDWNPNIDELQLLTEILVSSSKRYNI